MRASFRVWVWVSALLLVPCAAAQADVDAWYELVSATGPAADALVSVDQGAAGKRLSVTLTNTPGPYQLTILMVANVGVDKPIIAHSTDLIAPVAANVTVDSVDLLGNFAFDFPPILSPGPGEIMNNAGQLNFGTALDGEMDLLEIVLTINQPPADTIELFSGIGALVWATSDASGFLVRYGDATPLESFIAGTVTDLPSIVISTAAPPDCDNDGFSDAEEITANPMIDCDSDGIPDGCEIASGTLDCNLNGIPDACDIANHVSLDADGNAIPDECDPPVEVVTTTGGTSQTTQTTTSTKLVNRTDLRNFLAALLGLPVDGIGPPSAWPLRLLGPFGANLSVVMAVGEIMNFPMRQFIFEITYAILDAILP
jgi:hypothetical protein